MNSVKPASVKPFSVTTALEPATQEGVVWSRNSVVLHYALYTARKTIREDWRNQGRKLSEIEARDITSFALAYLEGNPQLIEEASEAVMNDPGLRLLYERRERERAKLVTRAQRCER
jgi:hypothetical protein